MHSILKEIKAVILDMDGVLWKGDQPLCDLKLLFQSFTENHIQFLFATNNALSTVDQYIEKFHNFGVRVEKWQILTSSIATGFLLARDFPNGGAVHIMGSKALELTLLDYNFTSTDEDPIAVVGGLDMAVTYDRIKTASLFIQSGIPFYFTNPDATYPAPQGLLPGAGTFLATLETASGGKAKIAGKPQPYVFEAGLQRLGINANEVLVIGDRLETDILGGSRAGCKTALVLTGVAARNDLETWEPSPDVVLENITNLFDDIDR